MGSSKRIEYIIKTYEETASLNVLLLNANYCGSGLNLVNTDHIIMFHKMNHDMEKQIIGRANRLGRKKHLCVWKLLYNHEN